MLARINSATLLGIDAIGLQIEVDISRGLRSFTIVGLPDAAVRESRERVESAIRNSGFEFPIERITVVILPESGHVCLWVLWVRAARLRPGFGGPAG